MHLIKLKPGMTAVCVALALAGCASGVKLNGNAPVETRSPTPAPPVNGANGSGTAQSNVTSVDLNKGQADATASKVIYFDFDSDVIKDEYRSVIEAYAKTMMADHAKHLVVEGNTDERGGSEYNLALGQRRAEAVTKALTLLGVASTQVEAVSFGKERPAVQGDDETAWSKNRRAELVYR